MTLDMEAMLFAMDEVLDRRARIVQLRGPGWRADVRMEGGKPVMEIFPFCLQVKSGGVAPELIEIVRARDVLFRLAADRQDHEMQRMGSVLNKLVVEIYGDVQAVVSGRVEVN